MNTLLIIQFETGDSSVRYYEVPIVVKECSWAKCNEIEDSFASFVESEDDDLEYEDVVEKVMEASGLKYEFSQGDIPACKLVRTIQI